MEGVDLVQRLEGVGCRMLDVAEMTPLVSLGICKAHLFTLFFKHLFLFVTIFELVRVASNHFLDTHFEE